MIKNGRPYTVDGKVVDDALIDSMAYEAVIKASEWVRENVRKGNRIHPTTSYGMKHKLEGATDVYLTNNQFKDLMLLAGYEPVDANALNWSYRVSLKDDRVYNHSPFVSWLRLYARLGEKPAITNFAHYVNFDENFPAIAHYGTIRMYLEDRGAVSTYMNAFEEAWATYTNRNNPCSR